MNDDKLDQLYTDLVLVGDQSRPGLTLQLVTSLNGAATGPDGRSGSLGGEADTVSMRRVRDAADVIVAGGTTVRHENYGPVRTDPERAQHRLAKGLSAVPRLAVLTNSGVDTARLRGDGAPPILLTSNGDLRDDPNAEVVLLDEPVRPADVLASLAGLGLGRILCEGGPTLARWFLEAGVVDELFLTIAPSIVGGQRRLLSDPLPELDLELLSAVRHDNDVLVRYRIPRS
ncbi:MAG TPA: dihydrofolate reductase family protein [Nitriliruptorales bacterium]